MKVQLIVDDGDKKGQTIPVNVPTFMIGRAKGCHLRSPSSHVSRQHCIIHIRNNTVTIQDLGGENGTYVNGQRISAQQVLSDGDKLGIGSHTFFLSIDTTQATQPTAAPQESSRFDPVSELMFEVRFEGQLVSVTKNKLFDLAERGKINPDDLITIAGTKVFADSIEGIVFGNAPPAAAPPPPISAASFMPPPSVAANAVWKNEANANPFDTAVSEPSSYVPPPQRHSRPVMEEQIVTSRKPLDSSEKIDLLTRAKQFLAIILLVGGVSAGIWYFYSGEEQQKDIFPVEGTITLDGEPVQGVSVTLNPREEGGAIAGGLTNTRGVFRVTTGAAPVGSGAKAGMYDITFSKVKIEQSKKNYLIPQKYGNSKTSGIEPINVESGGKNSFTFPLTTSGDSTKPSKTENVPPVKSGTKDARKAGNRLTVNVKTLNMLSVGVLPERS